MKKIIFGYIVQCLIFLTICLIGYFTSKLTNLFYFSMPSIIIGEFAILFAKIWDGIYREFMEE